MRKIDPVHSYKILSCFDKVLEIQNGKMPIPRTLEFFISNKCNHSCIGCHSKSLHKDKVEFLDIKKAKEVLDEAKEFGVKGIEISGGGEPLLHPDIIEFVEYTNEKGLKSGLLTNGTVFNKDNIESLVKNLLFIRIAFEAPDKQSYKKIHGVDDFDKLIENIGNLIEVRRKTKSKVTIGTKC
ncbi:radical SAM protein, partial [bacterium]|nr:radical SAM protein [bacterium]